MTAVEVADFFAGLRRVVRRTRARAHHRPPRHPRWTRLRRRPPTTATFHAQQRRRSPPAGATGRRSRRRRAGSRPHVHQVVPSEYRRPDDLPDGGVLVVGASATGVQLADELHRSGRPVTLAVGSHSRMPRHYRGMDSFWWLDQLGAFDRTIDDVGDIAAARREPSLQLVGRPDHATLDLATPAIGRCPPRRPAERRSTAPRVTFGTDLAPRSRPPTSACDAVLDRIDDAIDRLGLGSEVLAPEPSHPCRTLEDVPDSLDLGPAGITSVVWATGYRRRYDWLDLPILDAAGEIRQHRGVTPVPGRLRAGPALPALPQLELHRRCRPRRRVRRRPHLSAIHRPATPAHQIRSRPELSPTMHATTTHPRTAPPTTWSSSAAAPPAPPPPCCSPGTACDAVVLERGALGADTLSTHALMRGGVLQLSALGPARPRSSPPARRR